MKKSLKDKINRIRKQDEQAPPSRITNETVAEHRERILAGGRKFKYPVQYSRHKLVINTILISVATIALLVLLGWWQLYIVQNTSKFMYRVTQLVPVSVASVDGAPVRFSDYLMKFRSSIHFLQQQNAINVNTEDGKRQVEFYKRQELDSAIRDAYTTKLAHEHNITVSDAEVDAFIQAELNAKKVSIEAYERTVLNNFYDWSLDEYKGVVRNELLERKVGFAIDTAAKDKVQSIKESLDKGGDFAKLARQHSDDITTKNNGGTIGDMPINNQDPNGVIAVALELRPGQVSDIIEGADGYYIVKLIEKDNTTVNYAQIKVSLTELDKRFEAVKEAGKINEHISVDRQEER